MTTTKERLKDLRADYRWTQHELAEQLYISESAYAIYEENPHTMPITILMHLSFIYGVSADYLLGITDNPATHGMKSLSLCLKKETMRKLDSIAEESNQTRNELINLFLQYGVEHEKIIDK